MVALMRLPNLMYGSTARILSSYEYMNYLLPLVVQVFVRTPLTGADVFLLQGSLFPFSRQSDAGYCDCIPTTEEVT
jgi:hypothetical protein